MCLALTVSGAFFQVRLIRAIVSLEGGTKSWTARFQRDKSYQLFPLFLGIKPSKNRKALTQQTENQLLEIP
ncbi:expressed protein [Phakopsora pachyrhizi]|uniref:Expressed protein n=1 Tax=Phakopsora pachyrhizi TaxID=170000 RepID=A0AAV0AKC3_PHAPC|nr:expressed protein [Phakopsora pachyrhizi]